ncbi:MAG: hypothetical protein IKV61_05340 [Clostridia bacterium]|nr:hypothetical protein [Clostridia bacterium]
MAKNLIAYSIMPSQITSDDQIIEICNDVQLQYEQGVCTLALFCMPLHPNCNPVFDKAEYFTETYKKIKKELDKRGLKSGVLIQSTLGHGDVLNEPPFQQYVKLTDGTNGGITCPLDTNFQKYLYDSVVKIASCGPTTILIDDDFRLMPRGGKACACKKHMERFNERAKSNVSREELFKIVTSDDSRCCEYTKILFDVQNESLEELAQVIRSAIDSVDPTIQGVFCSGGDDAVNIAKILAGKNNPTILRINNGYYSYNSTSGFTYSLFSAAMQLSIYKGVDYYLMEADTCPHVRYSKSAKQLNAHYIGSILEGVNGAKQWITRLNKSKNIEWQSAIAYRKMLSKNANLYQTVSNLVEGITWHGFKIPIQKVRKPNFKKPVNAYINSFGELCLERLGLPMYYSTKVGGITCFTDNNDEFFTDEELKVELTGNAIFSSETAKKVAERGFEKYLGVKVEDYVGIKPMGDLIFATGNAVQPQLEYKKLVKLNDKVKATSHLIYNTFEKELAYLSDGTLEYKNELGGNITVFAGHPKTEVAQKIYGYSFLNESRKAQFIEILKGSGQPVIYYANDETVYLKTGTLPSGKNLTSIFSLCYDEIEQVKLVYPTKPKKVSFVDSDGSIKELPFEYKNGTIYLEKTLYCFDVLILIIE